MQVAVNTRFLLPGNLQGFGVYTYELLKRIIPDHPDDSFDLYFDRTPSPMFSFPSNAKEHSVGPPARHPLLFWVWFQLRIKKRIESSGANVFFSPGSFMPLGMSVPSVITIHDVAYLRYPEFISGAQLKYYRKYLPKFIDEAAHILTVSEFSKKEICEHFTVPEEKVTVVHNGASDRFHPIEEEARIATRARYSHGRPYFLYVGAIHPRKNLVRLIRAFEIFKQQTGDETTLVIAGRKSWQFNDVVSAVDSSPFKEDIHMPGFVPEKDLPLLIGSAGALTYISLYEGFGLPVVESMACGTPVLTSSAKSTGAVLAEVGGNAVLQVDPMDERSIANGMQRINSDSELRDALIRKGIIRAAKFNWDDAARSTYEILRAHAR